ncbi:unnamed protein product [Ambrosiozyma monospora]|uniref:Unnamed protein product n=1 Tax=Ambrosiozyma monospora TaxID=43982 RepID=A0A9W6YXK0_AMBMO|nr:unnamed protein product [Ambrosiozyma monospora]
MAHQEDDDPHFREIYIPIGGRLVSLPTTVSYLFDLLLYISVLLIALMWGRLSIPNLSEFSPTDRTLWYTYKPEVQTYAPIWALLLCSIIVPVVVMFIISLSVGISLPVDRRLWDFTMGILALLGAASFQLLIVCILKNTTGKYRPDFVSRCVLDDRALTFLQTFHPGQLLNIDFCVSTNFSLIYEGLRSFPSGHASTIFCVLTVQCLFCAGKLTVFDGRSLSFKILFCFLFPYSIASLIALSRVSDHRHFIEDVLFGSLIGIITGVLFYHLYFPPPHIIQNVGRAYNPRRFGMNHYFNGVGGFWKIQDLDGFEQQRVRPPDEEDPISPNQLPQTKKERIRESIASLRSALPPTEFMGSRTS